MFIKSESHLNQQYQKEMEPLSILMKMTPPES